MAAEIISLISSSPSAARATPQLAEPPNPRKRLSGAALGDVTDRATDSRPRPEKRTRRESPPRRNRFLESLELSDLSDLDGLPELAEPRPRAVARDPALVFGRRRERRSPSPVRRDAARRVPAFDDPIELSSTPDLAPKRKPDVRAAAARKAPARPAAGPFLFSSSPERIPSPVREVNGRGNEPAPARQRRSTPPRCTSRSTYPLDSPSPIRNVSPPRLPREWDPISSSAPEPQKPTVIDLDSDAETPDIPSDDSFPDLENIRAAPISARPYLDPITLTPPPKPRAKTTLKRASSYNITTTTAAAAAPKKSAEERTRDKELRTAAREAEKAQKKKEREDAKAQRAQEKERAAALAEVNKVRTDKKVSAREMIVDLPSTLDETVALQARTLLGDLGIEGSGWEGPVPGVVRWRRKVRSVFDEERGHYEPVPERIETEGIAMAVLRAEEFVEMSLGVEGRDLERHVRMMKRHFPGSELLYLIEGLEPWSRRNRALRNRQFAAAVRAEAPSRRTTHAREPVDEEIIEDALMGLQVRHKARIHHAAAGIETARWIATFTQHVSTAPYRRRRDGINDAAAAFCMDAGQVRCGEGPREVYVGMLQEVGRVSASAAYGVAEEFGGVGELVRGLEGGGPLALQGCRKAVGRGGEMGERTVGPALSRRIYRVFMGRDEDSTDV